MDQFGSQEKRKMPEFIVVEDATQQQEYFRPKGPEMSFQAFRNLEAGKYPLMLRVLFLGLSVIFGFLAFLFGVLLLVSLFLSAITLFQFQGSIDYNRQLWKRIKKVLVLALGFFVATFSPPLGLGIIMLYFMMLGEEINSFLKTRFMQPPFENQ